MWKEGYNLRNSFWYSCWSFFLSFTSFYFLPFKTSTFLTVIFLHSYPLCSYRSAWSDSRAVQILMGITTWFFRSLTRVCGIVVVLAQKVNEFGLWNILEWTSINFTHVFDKHYIFHLLLGSSALVAVLWNGSLNKEILQVWGWLIQELFVL